VVAKTTILFINGKISVKINHYNKGTIIDDEQMTITHKSSRDSRIIFKTV